MSVQPHGRRRYRHAVLLLSAAQKSGAGVPAYLRWVNRGLGRRAAALAYVCRLTPNAVTALSILASLCGLFVVAFAASRWQFAVLASVLLLIGYALDSADGQLARLLEAGGPAGEWLDHVVDSLRLPLVHVAIGIHFYRTDGSVWLIAAAGVFALLSSVWFFAQTLAEKLEAVVGRNASSREPAAWVSFAKLPYDVGTLYLALALLAWHAAFTVVYVALLALTGVVACGSMVRKYRALRSVRPAERDVVP